MKHYRLLLIIGIIEILIGSVTIFANCLFIIFGINSKPPSVLTFVILAGTISTLLGIGLLKYKRLAYDLLFYFSTVIILSKILILLHVIHLNGALETTVPAPIKNNISIIYHGFVIFYLNKTGIKRIFHHCPVCKP